MKQPPHAAAGFKFLARMIAVAIPSLLIGCAEAQFRLAPDSPIPRRWSSDVRTKGWQTYYIEYVCYWEKVVAHVCPHRCGWWADDDCGGCITSVGTARKELQRYPGGPIVLAITFDGIEESYEVREDYPDQPGRVLYLISGK